MLWSWDIAKLLISEAKTLSKVIEFLGIMSKAAVSSTNLMLITAKTNTPSFAPWSTPPFRVCQSDRVPPILTACYRLVRKAAIHFRRTGWISSLASSCIRGVVNKMKSLCEISEEQSSRSLTTIHRFINSLQYVQKGICCRMVWLSSEIEFNQFFSQMFCFWLSSTKFDYGTVGVVTSEITGWAN